MNPNDLLEQLKATAGTRRKKSLEIVDAVCREQFERGSKDFSLATIGRLSHESGGPTKQTIANKTGDDFKGLIAAWASHTGGSLRRQPKVNENPISAVIEKIPDPAVRAVIGSILAENRKLRGENNLLKRDSRIVIDQRPASPVGGAQTIQVLPASIGLTDSERDALRHAISDKLLQDEGWRLDASGRIVTEKNNRTIFKVGFVSAVRKVIGSLNKT